MLQHQRGQRLVRLDGPELGVASESPQSVSSLIATELAGAGQSRSKEIYPTPIGDAEPSFFAGADVLDESTIMSRDDGDPDKLLESWAEAGAQDGVRQPYPARTGGDADFVDQDHQDTPPAHAQRKGYRRPVMASALVGALVFAGAVPLVHNAGTGSRASSDQPSVIQTVQWPDEGGGAGASSPLSKKIEDRLPSEAPVKQDRLPSGLETAAASRNAGSDQVPVDRLDPQEAPAVVANANPPELHVSPTAPATAAPDVPARVRTFIVYSDGTVVRPSDEISEPMTAAAAAIPAAAPEANANPPSAQPAVQVSPPAEPATAATAPTEVARERPPPAPAQQRAALRAPSNSDLVAIPLPTRKPRVARAQGAARPSPPSSAPQWQSEVFAR